MNQGTTTDIQLRHLATRMAVEIGKTEIREALSSPANMEKFMRYLRVQLEHVYQNRPL